MRKTSDILWQDAQHQVLFDILDQIKQPDADVTVLLRLKEYTESHFALEELYMTRLNYPYLAEHVEAHQRFRGEILELLDRGEEFDEVYRQLTATFLTEWLKRHVFGTDKKLEAFLLASETH
ncbi:MAG: hypothetical protein Hals2KO_18310 [Halioglobus sp.]